MLRTNSVELKQKVAENAESFHILCDLRGLLFNSLPSKRSRHRLAVKRFCGTFAAKKENSRSSNMFASLLVVITRNNVAIYAKRTWPNTAMFAENPWPRTGR
ncbi:MAG: hypothetical protein CMJ78_17350 [Planctomycetaceae bacterium]|nr:hypothetical protein [Planctomycetaceae bacterium]